MTTLPGSPPAGGPELGVDTMDLLRFATIGSVDDGKSTLIGRLLFDTRQLFDDQLTAIETASERRGLGEVDLSFVTDGLRAEREQGITIDVAYRYAATPHRKFVIADCPGHIQYTRNMATGASTADLALVLVDATSASRRCSAWTSSSCAPTRWISSTGTAPPTNASPMRWRRWPTGSASRRAP
jgi:sulfate adenylyltransferase subunit 1 (EFTu-like GTPase family)